MNELDSACNDNDNDKGTFIAPYLLRAHCILYN